MSGQQPATGASSGGRWSNLERWQQLSAAMIGLVGTLGAVVLTIALTNDGGDGQRPQQPGRTPTTVSTPSQPNASGASFQLVQLGPQTQGGYQYHLQIEFSGLKGQACTVVWETVYLDNGTAGDSSGTTTTEVLLYDRVKWEYDIVVRPPSGATAGRHWRTVFKVLSPERILLATGG